MVYNIALLNLRTCDISVEENIFFFWDTAAQRSKIKKNTNLKETLGHIENWHEPWQNLSISKLGKRPLVVSQRFEVWKTDYGQRSLKSNDFASCLTKRIQKLDDFTLDSENLQATWQKSTRYSVYSITEIVIVTHFKRNNVLGINTLEQKQSSGHVFSYLSETKNGTAVSMKAISNTSTSSYLKIKPLNCDLLALTCYLFRTFFLPKLKTIETPFKSYQQR